MFFAGKTVGVFRVGIRGCLDSGVFVGVYALAEVDGVFEFLAKDWFAGVPGSFSFF